MRYAICRLNGVVFTWEFTLAEMTELVKLAPDYEFIRSVEASYPTEALELHEELEAMVVAPSSSRDLPTLNLETLEKLAILRALEVTKYVQKDAAALLGISRRSLNYKIKYYGITYSKWTKNV